MNAEDGTSQFSGFDQRPTEHSTTNQMASLSVSSRIAWVCRQTNASCRISDLRIAIMYFILDTLYDWSKCIPMEIFFLFYMTKIVIMHKYQVFREFYTLLFAQFISMS